MRPSHWLNWGRLRVTGRAPRTGVVFHHIPKCAGTAVRGAIRRCYRPDLTVDINSVPSIRAVARLEFSGAEPCMYGTDGTLMERALVLRTEMLHYHLSSKTLCGGGHIPFSCTLYDDFHETHKFVTVLRDPVDRFMSQYFWSRDRGVHDRIDRPLDRGLVETIGPLWGSMLIAFLSGLPWTADHRSEEAIEAAKANLAKFSVVGFLDDMPSFSAALRDQLGIPVRIPHANRSPASREERDGIAPELVESIRDACAPDIELYAHACNIAGRGEATAVTREERQYAAE